MTLAIPKFAALKNKESGKYLEYINIGSISGSLKYSSENLMSVLTKFALEPAKVGGEFINIRCCYNNKYLASSNDKYCMVTPFAKKPQEDQHKGPCTLFKVIEIPSEGGYYLLDVKLQTYVAVCNTNDNHKDCLTTRYPLQTNNITKLHVFIDYEMLVMLPKHVVFKGDNEKYLQAYWFRDWEYLQFSSDDIGDPRASHTIFTMNDGSVRIMCDHWKKFWKRVPNWVLANSTDTTANDKNTLFWPVRVSKNVVALRNLANNQYCRRLTADGKVGCLNASIESIIKEAHLEIQEPIILREIYNVVFRTLDDFIYDEKVITLAYGDASNSGDEPVNVQLRLKYTEESSKCWDSSLTMSMGVSTSLEAGIPMIGDASINMDLNFSGSYTWGETLNESKEVETTYTVNVPAKTRMKVSLLATMGKCNIPFSYTQRDILSTGEQVITRYDDGVYTGSNCYKFKYDNKPIPF